MGRLAMSRIADARSCTNDGLVWVPEGVINCCCVLEFSETKE